MMTVKPSYTVVGTRSDDHVPTDVVLTNVWEKEVKVVVEILRRMGMDISVKQIRPFSGFADEFRAQTVVEVEALPLHDVEVCQDCGGDIYGAGAPAICAGGHKCSLCGKHWNKHNDNTCWRRP